MRKTSLCRDLTYRSLFNLRSMLVPLLLVLSVTMPNPVQAANPMVTVGTASRPAGNPVDLDVSFAPGSTAVSTMTIDLSLPSALSYISTATGAAANAAGKTAQGNAIPGGVRILIFGVNQTAIGTGVVATIRLNISPGAVLGTLTVGVAGVSASDPNGISVSATGSPGGVNVVDGTAPVISGVTGSSVTSSAATISWTTSEASDSQVDYGTSTAYENSTVLNAAKVTSHSQALAGLNSSTLYHYRVKSSDASGNQAVSPDSTFTTLGGTDTTPPVISNVLAAGISNAAATITWTTNEVSDSQVDYGTSTSYGSSTALDSTMVMSHARGLSHLNANTTYHYRVKSRDGAGNLAVSGDFSFVTPGATDTTPPVITGVTATGVSSTAATISWATDEASDSQVEYGASTSYGSSTTLNSALATIHSQGLNGLGANTTYHYRVKSRDAAGNQAVSGDFTFATSGTADNKPPVVSAVAASNISTAMVMITWTTDEASDSQVEYGTSASYGSATAANATMSTSHSQALGGLGSNTTYHYRVKSRDAAGNLAVSGDFIFTTPQVDTRTPVISAVTTTIVSSTGVTITWSTDEVSDSQVEYGTYSSYGSNAARDATMVIAHSQALSGLGPNTTYHYRVKSQDAAGNLAVSADYVFTTSAATDTTPPVISAVVSSQMTNTGAMISWTTDRASDSQVEYGTSPSYGSATVLNSVMVTSHSQQLVGLSPNTTYHYRVKSRDASGNLAMSANSVFTTTSGSSHTTPPVISVVAASGITSAGATITWITDEGSDSQVEYGTSASYGSFTNLDSAVVTSHSQVLGGLTAKTTYHYRVKSRDASGNAATSGDSTFTTAAGSDTTPPVISSVKDSGISKTGARIVWSTDEPSDSQVEYGTSASYGSASSLNGVLGTSHAQIISGLRPGTIYHYRVRSKDAAGNLSVSVDLAFQTTPASDSTQAARVLRYPRTMLGSKNQADIYEDEFTGLALVNQDVVSAELRFTVFDRSGVAVKAPDILNPVTLRLAPSQQLAVVDTDLFGSGLEFQDNGGWIMIESNAQRVAGFFMMFNSSVSALDGADIHTTPVSSFILPESDDQGLGRLELANPNAQPADLTLELISQNGKVRATAYRTIQESGFQHYEVFADLFRNLTPNASDYIRVASSQGVHPMQVVGSGCNCIEVLNGQDAAAGATILYSPQYVSGGIWRTSLSVINLDSTSGTVSLRLIGDDGTQIGSQRSLAIGARGKIYISEQDFFMTGSPDVPGRISQGYLEINGGGLRLSGSVSFGDSQRKLFCTALPLVSSLSKSMFFAHITSDSAYYMGLAFLNPNDAEASVRIELYDSEGKLDRYISLALGAHQRKSDLLTNFFPDLVGQERRSGYIKITSDKSLAGFALFGSTDMSNLASIPAQPQP